MNTSRLVIIAVGANLPSPAGPPHATFTAAASELDRSGLRISAQARIIQTKPLPDQTEQPDYLNTVWFCWTQLAPQPLLNRLLEVELQFGRCRDALWSARPLDLDLIAYGDLVTAGYWGAAAEGHRPPEVPPPLILPHPRMHHRRFVLEPLAEIEPDWRHPALGLTARDLLARLDEPA